MRYKFLISSALVLSLIPAAASAQEAAPAADTVEASDEIVVTAQKREQALTDVGISVNVISGDDLLTRGVTSSSDLDKVVAGLSITPANVGLSGTPIYTLRGVGFNERSLSALSAVSIYQDELPLSYPYMTAGPLLDLQRVEVLKGPQGTLYGQNSTGGSINYISRKPGKTFETGGTATYGRFNRVDVEGYVSGPLSDTLGVRASGRFIGQDGWQRSRSRPDDRLGSINQLAGRLLVDWEPASWLRLSLNLNGWRDKSQTPATQVIGVNPSQLPLFNGQLPFPFPFLGAVTTSLTPNPTIRDADWTPGQNYKNDTKFWQGALRADIDLSDQITLTSLTSLARLDVYSPRDLDGSPALLNNGVTSGDIDTFNQEVRLSGDMGRLNWIVGGNYSKDKIDSLFTSNVSGTTNGVLFAATVGVTGFVGDTISHTDRESYAGFANADFRITDSLTFTGGIRYTKVKLDYTGCTADNGSGQFSAFFGFLAGIFGVPAPHAGPGQCITMLTQVIPGVGPLPVGQGLVVRSLDENNVSWRAGLNFKPSEDSLIYASVNRGYKSGDIPAAVGLFDTQLVPVVQEKLTAYEVGFKTRVGGRLAQINAAAFYYDYRDKQLYGVVQQPAPLSFLAEQTINIPKVRVMGAELELILRPARGLTVNTNIGYTDSKILEAPILDTAFSSPTLPLSPTFASTGKGNVVGDPVNLAPKFQANADFEYAFGIGEREGFFGGSVSHASSTLAFIGADESARLDARTLVGARIGIRDEAHGWRAMLWGNNIFNENYTAAVLRGQDITSRYPGMPATYGVTIGFDLK